MSNSKANERTHLLAQNYEEIDSYIPEVTTSKTIDRIQGEPKHEPKLSRLFKLGFSLGHVNNDLCASLWFSYLLLFLTSIRGLSSGVAGGLLLLGQIADAVATPIVGYLTDRIGTKKQWYIFGSLTVMITFPLIFSGCPGCNRNDDSLYVADLAFYAIVTAAVQIAWAVVQISHLAMIPQYGKTQNDRADLTAIRYAGTVVSSVTVFIVTWAVLHSNNRESGTLGKEDKATFRNISIILTAIGAIATVVFHLTLTVHEKRQRCSVLSNRSIEPLETGLAKKTNEENNEIDEEKRNEEHVYKSNTNSLLRCPLLYQVTLLYVSARLFQTLALVYMPLWLDEREAVSKLRFINHANDTSYVELMSTPATTGVEDIALVPLVSFIASFFAALFLKLSNNVCSSQMEYFFGLVASISACIWVYEVTPEFVRANLYGIAILFGFGGSVTQISSLCLTAEIAGEIVSSGGFIYAAVTFADKLITGLVVIVIENMKCTSLDQCPTYYQSVLANVCGGSAILGVVTLITLRFKKS